MLQYTKGEWTIFDGYKDLFGFVVRTNGYGELARCKGEDAEANANLIVASPELYEALKELIAETDLFDVEECDHDVGICWCSYKNARFKAAHVLAKAEGKGS